MIVLTDLTISTITKEVTRQRPNQRDLLYCFFFLFLIGTKRSVIHD